MSTGTLHYFQGHGKAGAIRMMLAHGGIEYTDKTHSFEEWPALKPTMPNGNVPAWQPAGSELMLGQSCAILHMLGMEHGYIAETSEGTFRQEFVIECFNDFYNTKTYYFVMKDEITEEQVEEWTKSIETLWTRVNKILAHDNSKFVAGDKLTIGDFILFNFVTTFMANPSIKHAAMEPPMVACIEKNEHVNRWYQTMNEECKSYLENRIGAFF